MPRLAPLAILLLGLTAAAGAEDWPRFRGPNGTGVSGATGVPILWTRTEYAWTLKLAGTGHSSPVTWDGTVFVTSCGRKEGTLHVQAFACSDGDELWTRSFGFERYMINQDNSYAASTPCADADRLYVYWQTPESVTVAALDHAGKDVWRRELGPFKSEHGGAVSPMVCGELVVIANDQKGESSLIALDRATGETRWTVPRTSTKAAYATPIIHRPDGGAPELIFLSQSHGVTSVDPATGTVNWEFAKAFPIRVVASPALADGLVVGTCQVGGRGRRLVAVRPGGPGVEPVLAWERKERVPAVPVPLAKDGRLYLWTNHGEVTCVKAATGESLWEARVKDRFYGSPVWAEGRLYCISRKGVCYVVDAATGKELGSTPLGERSFATPALARGRLYLRTLSRLLALACKE
jgi:outer membrane protein assembly factor BamB